MMPEIGWQVQLRRRGFPNDWEPVSLKLATQSARDVFTRDYHYDTLEDAKRELRLFIGVEGGFANTLFRMATGKEKILELYEVRFIRIGSVVSFEQAFAAPLPESTTSALPAAGRGINKKKKS